MSEKYYSSQFSDAKKGFTKVDKEFCDKTTKKFANFSNTIKKSQNFRQKARQKENVGYFKIFTFSDELTELEGHNYCRLRLFVKILIVLFT